MMGGLVPVNVAGCHGAGDAGRRKDAGGVPRNRRPSKRLVRCRTASFDRPPVVVSR